MILGTIDTMILGILKNDLGKKKVNRLLECKVRNIIRLLLGKTMKSLL